MRVYLVWYKTERSADVVDVTKAVEDTMEQVPQLPRVAIITSMMDMLDADEVITADNDEQMLAMFENVTIVSMPKSKEELH